MSETSDQIALFGLLKRLEGRYPLLALCFHVPNGEKRDKATAARLQAMGVKPGVPDVLCPVQHYEATANVWYNGLAVELKTARGRTSPDQGRWIGWLRQQGWRVEVCRDWADAARLIIAWVGGDPRMVEGL